MQKWVTWQGPFKDSGAYATINRNLTAVFRSRGWKVSENLHNADSELAPALVSCVYPPAPLQLRHDVNVCVSNWEFTGPRGVPASFIHTYNTYDVVVAKSAWTAANYRACGAQNVVHMLLGCNLPEFSLDGQTTDRSQYGIPEGAVFMLWVGGTDKRHAFDVAVRVLDGLPDNYWLLAKQSAHYPPQTVSHDRLVIVRDDLPSLAPLYRSADLLLHTARGVGSSMPVFEALACGLRVVSSDLPPVREIAALHPALADNVDFGTVELAYAGQHHLHHDCMPYWYEPDADTLIAACQNTRPRADVIEARETLSWERAAIELERHIVDANN